MSDTRLYCPECGNYLLTPSGEYGDCGCGWRQPPPDPNPELESELETLKYNVAIFLDHLNDVLEGRELDKISNELWQNLERYQK